MVNYQLYYKSPLYELRSLGGFFQSSTLGPEIHFNN